MAAVTPQQVIDVFEASQAETEIDAATETLGNGLAELFNQGSGGVTPQPLDADLTAIAALTGTGFPERVGDGVWQIVQTVPPKVYRHIQSSASSSWVVTHNLGRMPVGIHVVDSAGESIGCKVQHNEALTSFTCFHGAPISGSVSYA